MLTTEIRTNLGILFTALAAVAFSTTGCGYDGPKMTVEELNTAVETEPGGIMVIDVRPAVQYRKGHVEGAVNIPLETFDTGFQSLSRGEKKLVIICTCGRRALAAIKKLAKRGIEATLVVGGYQEWEKAGFALQRGQ